MDHSNIENEAYGEGHGKQFAITSWAVKNRTTVIVITALIFVYASPTRWMRIITPITSPAQPTSVP